MKLHSSSWLGRLKSFAMAHKVISLGIAFVVLFGAYKIYGAATGTAEATQYITTAVSKGSVIATITGSGQVSASNQVDVKPKASGDVVSVSVVEGQTVKQGALLVSLDAGNAVKAVRDAETNLESAKLSLEKLTKPADALSTLQAENSLAAATKTKEDSEHDLVKSYDDGFNDVSNAFLELPAVMTGLDDVLYGYEVNSGQSNAAAYYDLIKNARQDADQFRLAAQNSYQSARTAYDKNLTDYRNASRYSDHAAIESLIAETYDTTKTIAEAIKNTKNFLDLVADTLTNQGSHSLVPSVLASQQTTLQEYTGTTNSQLGMLLTAKNSITNAADAIVSATRTIAERSASLEDLKSGPDELDVRTQQLAVEQRQNSLADAKETLADYYVRAPFDGIVAKVSIKKGDSASSGSAVATLVTKQRVAELSLNEIDVSKLRVGQKATLTFDAIPDLSISGAVASIDTVGTVTQGVVTYAVKISFDTQDDRVKPGMSVSAAIITDIKQDVLAVPSSAVKSQGTTQYVEVFDSLSQGASVGQAFASAILPREQEVEVGLSSDTQVEIISGLKAGDIIVTRTVSAAAQTTSATAAPSLFGGSNRSASGGAVRIQR